MRHYHKHKLAVELLAQRLPHCLDGLRTRHRTGWQTRHRGMLSADTVTMNVSLLIDHLSGTAYLLNFGHLTFRWTFSKPD